MHLNVLLKESNYSIFEYNICVTTYSPNKDTYTTFYSIEPCWTIKFVSDLLLAIKYNAILCQRQDECNKCIRVSDGHSWTITYF